MPLCDCLAITTPATAAAAAAAAAAVAVAGGEALTPKLAEDICATLPGLQRGGLFNSYGPTEVTVTVSSWLRS
jgi:non-ribosomal peptide synthetase component F